ncbi:S9 family peptidase [Dyella nitratireducens]|uniref:Peptidase S9 n=1 Tax=Dyella nitratireducens TaxID=1849580 RepID=A0ABQ1FW04_9GAMM|nr:prolyl oligopeptidase family serine peptidase [Dyella nitratireducens]GGA30539.1 peptidase S9 [Dyella nitratireducens]GLQ42991.1 peptidase S9 [Dyella nitratireducens]
MRRLLLAGLIALTVLPVAAETPSTSPKLDLETIMANPDWMGQAVENPYWSVDGRSLYYSVKRDGSSVHDLYRVDPATGNNIKLDAAATAKAEGAAVYDRAHRRAAYIFHGDVFLVDLGSGRRTQVTRSALPESSPRFSADGRSLQFRETNNWYVYDIASGVTSPAAVLKFTDDPNDKKPDALGQQQLDLFKDLRENKQDKDALHANEQTLAAADPTRAPQPFYLGDKSQLMDTELSPDGRWMLVLTQPAHHDDGKAPDVIHYVTDSGYTETEAARQYVGRNDPAPQSVLLLDLITHKSYPLATDNLPGVKDDPLKAIRAKTIAELQKAGKDDDAKALKAPDVRPVIMYTMDNGSPGIVWSDDGRNVALEFLAVDNKDRWIASVDFAHHALEPQHRLHNDAWISWGFNDFGWLKDNRTLWYLSEESGYSQLYVKPVDGAAKALTSGKFEVSQPQLSNDGRWFYLRTNKVAPYSYDVYRVPSNGGDLSRITQYGGMDQFTLSPDDTRLAVLHSSAYVLPQLAVQSVEGGTSRDLTHTMKPAFTAYHWIEPKIVEVPSSHGAGVIYAKYYGPENETDAQASRPAVLFVHGAGYLQDVKEAATYYQHEQLFNNLLVQEGYVVLDMDYRASEGYGSAWRTAIYRQMGHPELEDLLDGKAWLVKNHGVDSKRVGIYGGSYGGFMTEMALLRAPGEFAAGAAQRPPADWVTYNDPYTADILNRPELDPEAYKVSSPITYAANLRDPLLINHGLIDNNVMASDSIRLYQRFVELHKKNFWISLYPLERHEFEHADAWYDEYRRINELFETWVKPAASN